MIFKYNQLTRIKTGDITLAFRRWEKVSVKKGTTIRTAVGVISIDGVEKINEKEITKRDATKAGFDSLDELLKSLKTGDGPVYKISLSYKSEDPRIGLRSQTSMSDDDYEKLKAKLDRLDKTNGPWVMKALQLISKHPQRRAGDLADMMGMERLDFKLNVRKLKNLGLTISHEVGYSISPLGEVIMKKLTKR